MFLVLLFFGFFFCVFSLVLYFVYLFFFVFVFCGLILVVGLVCFFVALLLCFVSYAVCLAFACLVYPPLWLSAVFLVSVCVCLFLYFLASLYACLHVSVYACLSFGLLGRLKTFACLSLRLFACLFFRVCFSALRTQLLFFRLVRFIYFFFAYFDVPSGVSSRRPPKLYRFYRESPLRQGWGKPRGAKRPCR